MGRSSPISARQVGKVVGTWKLILAAVEPGNSASVDIHEVHPTADGFFTPSVLHDGAGITFTFHDGRQLIYYASNLLSAEYVPVKR